jgi:hypothetical protein
MTIVHGSRDCGNSPKNRFVQDVAVFLEAGPGKADALSDDVVWHGAADTPLNGRHAAQAWLAQRAKPSRIVVEHAISHGKVGAASGEVSFEDGRTRRFSHVLEFTSVKADSVARISSYT